MEITINSKLYEAVPEIEEEYCTGCAFKGDTFAECGEASSKYPCGVHSVIFVPKVNESVKFLTKNAPVEAPTDQKPGTKYDDEKIQYTLIPPYALQEVARNLTVGLRKYKERDNWKKVEGAEQRYMDALYRHVEAVRRGEIYDTESGAENMPHIAAVIANAMFLLEFMLDPKLKKG